MTPLLSSSTHDFTADIIAEDLADVEVRDGRLFWRGFYKPRAEAERLRDQFAATPSSDWFHNHAAFYAAQLTEALRHVQ